MAASRAGVMLQTGPLIAALGLLAAVAVGVLLARETSVGIAAMVGVCYAPVVFIALPAGLATWVPLAFLERFPQVGLGQTLVLAMLGAAWLGTQPAMRAHTSAVIRRHPAMFWSLLGLVTWITASVLWAGDIGAAGADFWNWLIVAAILVVLATALTNAKHVIAICVGFVIGALLTVLIGFAQGTATDAALATQEAGRLGAGLQDPNYLAAGIVPAAAITAGLFAVVRGHLGRVVLGATLLLLTVGLFATGSRGGLVAALVALVAGLMVARGRRLMIGGLALTLIAVATFWLATSSSADLDRVKNFESGTGRVDLWQVALRMSEDNPVAGVGINNFRTRSADYVLQPGRLESVDLIVDTPHVVHNVYLQQLAETGLIGLGLLLGFLGAVLVTTRNAARRLDRAGEPAMAVLARAILVAQLAMLTASFFISNGYDKRLWILLALGPALMTVAVARGRNRA